MTTIPGNETPCFSLACNELIQCRIVDIYDGDTVTAVIPVFQSHYKFRVRLQGINACEMRDADSAKKEMANKAKKRVFELLTGQTWDEKLLPRKKLQQYFDEHPCIAHINCGDFEKYGRLLGTIYPKGSSLSINDVLLSEGLAVAYEC